MTSKTPAISTFYDQNFTADTSPCQTRIALAENREQRATQPEPPKRSLEPIEIKRRVHVALGKATDDLPLKTDPKPASSSPIVVEESNEPCSKPLPALTLPAPGRILPTKGSLPVRERGRIWLRVRRGSGGDPSNLLQVMLAKGFPFPLPGAFTRI